MQVLNILLEISLSKDSIQTLSYWKTVHQSPTFKDLQDRWLLVALGCYAFTTYSYNYSTNVTTGKIVIVKDKSLAVENLLKSNKITVYPNPVSNHLKIDSDKKFIEIKLSDYSGNIIKTLDAKEREFDISNISSGNYLLIMTDINNNKTTEKIIKK